MMDRKAPVLVTALSALVACTDPVTPVRVLAVENAPLDVSLETFLFPDPGLPSNVGEGGIRLCKRVSAGDPGGTFNFTITTAGTGTLPDATPTLVVPSGGETCELVYRSIVPNASVDQVVIVEDSPPPDWSLSSINIQQLLYEGIYNAGNYVAPRLDDGDVPATRTATLYINNDMARQVTFTNDFTGTCDFITFGRLVVEVGSEKVVISGNAGGFNADNSIKGEFHIEANGADNHVADLTTYGAITSGPLSAFTNSRIVTGVAKNGVSVELRLWDGGEPGKGTDRVYVKLNGVELFAGGVAPLIDIGNMQYHNVCRGPEDKEETQGISANGRKKG
jgi:hypothetical protein